MAAKVIVAPLIGVLVGLLLVGVVSGTPLRHLIQVIPVAIVLWGAARQKSWAPYGALAVFLFWFLIMVLIWLWLLGVARIVTGQFSPAEILLTVAIGVSSAAGGIAVLGRPSSTRWLTRVGVFLVFATLQVGAMWVSLQAAFSSV